MQSAGSIQAAGNPTRSGVRQTACRLSVTVVLLVALTSPAALAQRRSDPSPDSGSGLELFQQLEPYGFPDIARSNRRDESGTTTKETGRAQSVTGPDWEVAAGDSAWQYLVLHHSGTTEGSVAGIHAEHRSRRDAAGNPWLGIGYHFVIGNGHGEPDGETVATFRWEHQIHGAHAGHAVYNARGIGICLIGNFEHGKPTRQQMKATRDLVAVLARRYSIPPHRIIGHAGIRATACPGKHFPLQEIRQVAADN